MQTETLLRRVQTGDADALDALVREYYPQILNYCRWHVPDAQQAQDAAQETFYKAVRWLDGCDVPFAVVFTKADKVGRGRYKQVAEQFGRELAAAGVAMPEHFFVSSTKREGREELLKFIEAQLG